jgi:hypothetical protein
MSYELIVNIAAGVLIGNISCSVIRATFMFIIEDRGMYRCEKSLKKVSNLSTQD